MGGTTVPFLTRISPFCYGWPRGMGQGRGGGAAGRGGGVLGAQHKEAKMLHTLR